MAEDNIFSSVCQCLALTGSIVALSVPQAAPPWQMSTISRPLRLPDVSISIFATAPSSYGLTKLRYIKRALIAYLLRKLFKEWISLLTPGTLIFQHVFSQEIGSFFGTFCILSYQTDHPDHPDNPDHDKKYAWKVWFQGSFALLFWCCPY